MSSLTAQLIQFVEKQLNLFAEIVAKETQKGPLTKEQILALWGVGKESDEKDEKEEKGEDEKEEKRLILDDIEEDFDMEDDPTSYVKWVQKYPKELTQIFANQLRYHIINSDDVKFFTSRGLDLNAVSDWYSSDVGLSNPLHTSCEFRNLSNMKTLLEAGADPNFVIKFEDGSDESPLEALLIGHSEDDTVDYKKTLQGLQILLKYAKPEIRATLWEEHPEACCNYKKSAKVVKIIDTFSVRQTSP